MVTMVTVEPGGWVWPVIDLYSVIAISLYLVFVESSHDQRHEYPTLKWKQVLEVFFLGISGAYIVMNKHPVEGFFCLLELAKENIKLLVLAYIVIASILYFAIVQRRQLIEQPKKIASLYHDVIVPFISASIEVCMITIMMGYIIAEMIAFVSVGVSASAAVTRFLLSAAAMNVPLLTETYLFAAVALYLLYDPVVNKKMSSILLEVVLVNTIFCYMVVVVLTLSVASVRLSVFLVSFFSTHWQTLLAAFTLLVSSFCFYKITVYFLPESNKQGRMNPWLSALLEILCVGLLFAYFGTVLLTFLVEFLYMVCGLAVPLLSSWKELLLLYVAVAVISFVIGIAVRPKDRPIEVSKHLSEVSSMSLEVITVVSVFLYYGLVLKVMGGGLFVGATDVLFALIWVLLEVWSTINPILQFIMVYRVEIFTFYATIAVFSYVGQVSAPSIGNKRNTMAERLGMVAICVLTAVFAFQVMAPEEVGFLQVMIPRGA